MTEDPIGYTDHLSLLTSPSVWEAEIRRLERVRIADSIITMDYD